MRDHRWPLSGLGTQLAWGQWLAALLDVIENTAILKMLLGSVSDPWPRIAQCGALPKFALVIAGIAYGCLYGLAAYLVPR